jgi:predicted transcriptional regulator
MLVNNLEKMEKIVRSSNYLEWDGWDVAKYTKSYNGMFSTDGAFKNGEWYKKKIFPLTESGWNIPNSIGKINEPMER